MVKKLTQEDEAAVREATAKAEHHTSAKISVVVLQASDHYQDFVLLYGFILGSVIGLGLWSFGILDAFLWLLSIQLGSILLMDLIPVLRKLCVNLVPQRVAHHRAKEIAHREYLVLHAEMPKEEPFILLFVSLAERYVHVLTNPVVHKKIPEGWNAVTGKFIEQIRKEGLHNACVQAVGHIGEILAPHFPRR